MTTASIIFGVIFAENLVFSRFFGIESSIGKGSRKNDFVAYCALMAVVTLLSGTLSVALYNMAIKPFDLEWLNSLTTFATVLITLAVTCAVHIISKKINTGMYDEMTRNMPYLSTNCIVIGSVWTCIDRELPTWKSAVYMIGAGLAFALAMLVLDSVKERMAETDSAKSYKKFPTLLLASAFAAMAFSGFLGIGA